MHTGFVQRGLPRSSPKNAAAPLYYWRPIEVRYPIFGIFSSFFLVRPVSAKTATTFWPPPPRRRARAATKSLVKPPSAIVLEVFESARRPKSHVAASLRHVRRLESARTPQKTPPSAFGAHAKRAVSRARSAAFGVLGGPCGGVAHPRQAPTQPGLRRLLLRPPSRTQRAAGGGSSFSWTHPPLPFSFLGFLAGRPCVILTSRVGRPLHSLSPSSAALSRDVYFAFFRKFWTPCCGTGGV